MVPYVLCACPACSQTPCGWVPSTFAGVEGPFDHGPLCIMWCGNVDVDVGPGTLPSHKWVKLSVIVRVHAYGSTIVGWVSSMVCAYHATLVCEGSAVAVGIVGIVAWAVGMVTVHTYVVVMCMYSIVMVVMVHTTSVCEDSVVAFHAYGCMVMVHTYGSTTLW